MSAAADDGMVSAEFQIQSPAPHHLSANAAPVRTTAGAAAAWVLVFHDITQLKSYETVRADFIANLTHEIRTPLSALCGYAETLVAGVEDRDTQRRFLGIIERQSRRLARLIDDLITLSDLERGLSPLRLEPLEVRRVAEEAVELMRERAERQGVIARDPLRRRRGSRGGRSRSLEPGDDQSARQRDQIHAARWPGNG